MNILNFQDELLEAILHTNGEELEDNCVADVLEIENILTFEEAGVASGDYGLVFQMADGSTFHLTITKED